MGMAVLYPHDCLNNTFSNQAFLPSPPMKTPKNSNPIRSNKPRSQSNRSKRSPPRSQSNSPPIKSTAHKLPTANLVMGQVQILKRGEVFSKTDLFQLSETVNKEERSDPDLESTARLGPGPELVPTQIGLAVSNKVAGLYAGSSACVESPPPSSVPLPAFFTKKRVALSNIDATIDLRRILRLDLP